MTIWETLEDGSERPYGQKMLLVDGEEIPILEIRKLEIRQAEKVTMPSFHLIE